MAEFRHGNLLFTANFDSGNLAKVEKVIKPDEEEETVVSTGYFGGDLKPDYEFNVWTNPDAAGTPFENGNRSWFYFGVRGYGPNRVIKINIMNMNRQGKLYSQGHSPFTKTVPGRPKWERIRERPSWETVDGQFTLSFTHRFLEFRGSTTYFAFCFPWSYTESQEQLIELDNKFHHCKNLPQNPAPESIYYHREVLCYSLQRQKVDLITISSCHGILPDREPVFDKHLFPEGHRCHKFKDKRVFVLSSRVHPGETPASFVFNGFLDFILREDDKRACQLRKMFVFKLIPMLNPDGVSNGHYRTDTRGVNLNRMYQDPDFKMHPSIYAAKSVIVYHHLSSRVPTMKDLPEFSVKFPGGYVISVGNEKDNGADKNLKHSPKGMCIAARNLNHNATSEMSGEKLSPSHGGEESHCDSMPYDQQDITDSASHKLSTEDGASDQLTFPAVRGSQTGDTSCTFSFTKTQLSSKPHLMVEPLDLSGLQSSVESFQQAKKGCNPPFSSSDSSILSAADTLPSVNTCNPFIVAQMSKLSLNDKNPLHLSLNKLDSESEGEGIGNEGSDEDDTAPIISDSIIFSPHLSDPNLKTIPPEHSGIAFYVDLHGHASKRGCFIYGNSLELEDSQVDNLLFPKLISMNTAHFDFPGCNFTERNMYARDKRDGMSKEGSGRVAMFKSLGLIHSYTLECNYNTGRMVNSVPPASGDNGRASPPPLAGFPPKYTIAHFEDVGKAVAIAALDMKDCNPWSRVTLSEHNSLQGVKEAVRRYLRGLRGGPRLPRNSSKTFSRTSSSGSLQSLTKPNNGSAANNSTTANKSQITRRASFTNNTNSGTKKELAPVREANRSTVANRRRMTVANCNLRSEGQIKSDSSDTKIDANITPIAMTTASELSSQGDSNEGAHSTPEDVRVDKLHPVKGNKTEFTPVTVRQRMFTRIPISVNKSVLTLTDSGNIVTGPVNNLQSGHSKPLVRPQHNPIPLGGNRSDVRPFSEKTSQISPQKQEKRKQFEATFNLPTALPVSLNDRHIIEPPKTDPPRRKSRKLNNLMKRRSVSHSPKMNYGKGGYSKSGSSNDSETEKKPRRRRKKSRQKSLNTPPSSEDTGQGPLQESALQGCSLPFSPRLPVSFTDLCLPFPNKRRREEFADSQPKYKSDSDLSIAGGIVRKPFSLAKDLGVYWMDP